MADSTCWPVGASAGSKALGSTISITGSVGELAILRRIEGILDRAHRRRDDQAALEIGAAEVRSAASSARCSFAALPRMRILRTRRTKPVSRWRGPSKIEKGGLRIDRRDDQAWPRSPRRSASMTPAGAIVLDDDATATLAFGRGFQRPSAVTALAIAAATAPMPPLGKARPPAVFRGCPARRL